MRGVPAEGEDVTRERAIEQYGRWAKDQWTVERFGALANVLPLNDLRRHRRGVDCDCRPAAEESDEGALIVHNSWDGREAWEALRVNRPMSMPPR